MRIRLLIMLFFLCNTIFSQTIIKGLTTELSQDALPNVSIVVKDSVNNTITYTYSDENGIYFLNIKTKGTYEIVFSSMGYKSIVNTLVLRTDTKEIVLNVSLQPESFELDEIIIQTEKTIKVKKDTVEIKVNKFLSANDATVEDLLKKIPGITVDSEGTIKIGNQEIEKLMIDGDDFFEKGYKILSKNMPPDQLEKVQILQRYSNKRLLKNIEESDKVALNLVLKEDAKRQWFGTVSLGHDLVSTGRYQLKTNMMNFGKKNKYILLTNFNNIGYNATGDINHLIKSLATEDNASIGDNQSVNSILNLSPDRLNFKESRTNFNNAELVSLNAIFNPTEKLKIKVLGFFNNDETKFFSNATNVVEVNNTNFTNTEDYQLQNNKRIAFGKLDFLYNVSQTIMVEATTKYNNGNFKDNSNLLFNANSTIENLQNQNILFDQKISYSNKFKEKKVFMLTGRFIDEKLPQNYSVNQFFFQDLFPTITNANNVKQQITNQMQFAGVNAHLLDRKDSGNLLELQLGNEFRKDNLQSTLSLLENNIVLEQPNGYHNQTSYQVNDLYLISKYRLKINDFDITGKLEVHQLFNRLENNNLTSTQNPLFVNPSLGFDWEINDKNKVTTSYSYDATNAKILDVFSDFVLTGFRSFAKGIGNFNQLDASSLVFNYQLGNWNDRFFANTFIIYVKNHDFFSTNTTIAQNFTQAEKILIKDREFISINSKLDYFFKFISSNLKLDLGYTKNEFKNIVNNSNFRLITSNNYNYGIEVRSGFKGIFNYHLGTKWTTTEIETTVNNSFTNNVSFLDISFMFNKNLDFQLQSERYFFGNLQTANTYYFLDFDTRYKLIENKLTLGITGKNLLNTERFRNFSISDIGTSTSEYRLLPRFVLLKMEYRF